MSKRSSLSRRVWWNQYDISGFTNTGKIAIQQTNPVVTCFSDGGPRRVADNYDHTHEHNGFMDTADDSYDERVFAELGKAGDSYLADLHDGIVEGAIIYESIVRLSEQPREVQVGQAQLLHLSNEGSNGVARGILLRNATISANGNSTGINHGVTTLNQVLQAVVRVFSGTFTSFDVAIQESQNDGGADPYATISGMTVSVSAVSVTRLTSTAASEAWKRVNIANWLGTSAVVGITLSVVAGT